MYKMAGFNASLSLVRGQIPSGTNIVKCTQMPVELFSDHLRLCMCLSYLSTSNFDQISKDRLLLLDVQNPNLMLEAPIAKGQCFRLINTSPIHISA